MRDESLDGVACGAVPASLALALALLAGLLSAPGATAAPPILWGGVGELVCPGGEPAERDDAGHCSNPRGVAADPENGHLFVANQGNRRIEEFNALGEFIKAWGWGVDTGAAELQTCTAESGCQVGLAGSGTGQFSELAMGVSVDSAGAVYVQDRGLLGSPNVRVQKFSPDGEFILMFGGEVNKTKVEEGGKSEAEENLCPFEVGDECQAGTIGTGQGQFGAWAIGDSIAIDRNGTATDADDDVYVGDVNRIQRFDTEGAYQDECAVAGSVQSLDVDSAGNLYRNSGASVKKLAYTTPECEDVTPTGGFVMPKLGAVAPSVSALAVESTGNVYAFGPTNSGTGATDPIFKFDPAGNLIEHFGSGQFTASTGMATNLCAGSEAPGNLYATNFSIPNAFLRAYGTEPIGCFRARTLPADPIAETAATLNGTVNPKGEAVTECFFEWGQTTAYGNVAPCDQSGAEIGEGSEPVPVDAEIAGLVKGTVYHFRLLAKVGGELETGSDESFKTLGPPVVSEEHASGATDTEASLRALVNPEGFSTTYRFQYTTEADFKAKGFEGAEETAPVGVGSDRSNHQAAALLEGLEPGQGYRWRVVASNSSGTTTSPDHLLRTYLPFAAPEGCANEAVRSGPSAPLPDCRAYEMVSPVDKNGGDIISGLGEGGGDPGGYMQASTDGNRIAYVSRISFGDQQSSFRFNEYLAERGGAGWSTHGIHPPVVGRSLASPIPGYAREFIAFSPDLCDAWLVSHEEPPLLEEAQPGHFNLLRRDNCAPGAGLLEALTTAVPLEGTTIKEYVDDEAVQGVSTDSRHALFVAEAKLTQQAAAGSGEQVYDRFEGQIMLVSVLPGGAPAPGDNLVGSGWGGNLEGGVSADGSRVYWTNGSSGEGDIYVREHPEQGIVAGECSEAGKACTKRVSPEGVTLGDAVFWGASPDGAKAIYTQKDLLSEETGLHLYELASESSQTIAADVLGVVGHAEDLGRVYFASREALPEAGPNSEEDEAVAGEPNLYLWEDDGGEGQTSFVGTLVEGDVGQQEGGASSVAYDLRSRNTFERATRASADGARIAFNSRAALTGYDNTEQQSGRPAVEVFAYEAGPGELHCVSCNPSGARPEGRELPFPYSYGERQPTQVIAAAWIPTWEHPNHASRALSEDGNRLFFNSNDALVPRDTNSAQDVYEWEAPGTGSCSEADPSFFESAGGCIYLISSGQSPYESEFWEAGPDGADVFFTTESSLVPPDPGLIDLYDARVGGGYTYPDPLPECEGEACQSPPPPPRFGDPASGAYRGPGNLTPAEPRRPRCPKGKRRARRGGKARCVKRGAAKKGSKTRRRAGHNRRAER